MGIKGIRKNSIQIVKPDPRKYDNSAHKRLCKIAGKWLTRHNQNIDVPNCPVICIDMVTCGKEIPDVIGWNGWCSVMIEVKDKRGDFLRDHKKEFRKIPGKGVGEFRYYFCPTGLIKGVEIPKDWGLLYLNENNKIEIIKVANRQKSNLMAERDILVSRIRRQ